MACSWMAMPIAKIRGVPIGFVEALCDTFVLPRQIRDEAKAPVYGIRARADDMIDLPEVFFLSVAHQDATGLEGKGIGNFRLTQAEELPAHPHCWRVHTGCARACKDIGDGEEVRTFPRPEE